MTLYRIQGVLKNYAWGSIERCVIDDFYARTDDELLQPAAELWYGVHSRCKCQINDLRTQQPSQPQYLNDLPAELVPNVLIKLLAVNQPLSIQIHPKAELAKKLHESHPELYPDPYGKDECCIPISDEFELFCGLNEEWISEEYQFTWFYSKLKGGLHLQHAQDLNDIDKIIKFWLSLPNSESKQALDFLYEEYRKDFNTASTLEAKNIRNKLGLCDRLQCHYRNDVGILAPFFFCYHKLHKGDCMLIKCGVPHSYISGSCLEIQVCSDNVIRGGLTLKNIDRDLFASCISKSMPKRIHIEPRRKIYQYTFDECDLKCISLSELAQYQKQKSDSSVNTAPLTYIVILQGSATLTTKTSSYSLERNVYILDDDEYQLNTDSQTRVYLITSNPKHNT